MTDDIKLPEPADYIYKCDGTLDVQLIPFYTADQLRAAVLADRAERKPLTDEQLLRAIRSVGGHARAALIREVGPYDIDEPTFVATLLCRAIERAHGIVEKESGNG